MKSHISKHTSMVLLFLLFFINGLSCIAQSHYAAYEETDKTELFFEDFNTNNFGWYTENDECHSYRVQNGFYFLKSSCDDYNAGCLFNNYTNFSIDQDKDFEIECDLLFVGQDNSTAWINWGCSREDESGERNFFRFQIGKDQRYYIGKYEMEYNYESGEYEDKWTAFENFKTSNTIRSTLPNKLTIRKVSDEYFFFINEELVYRRDFISFFGQSLEISSGENSAVQFDNISISRLSRDVAKESDYIGCSIQNVDFFENNAKIVLTYDLIAKKTDSYFNIDVKFLDKEGKQVRATNLEGDVKGVKPGSDKHIEWDVLRQGEELSGSYTAQLTARFASRQEIAQIKKKEEEDLKRYLEHKRFMNERATTTYDYKALFPETVKQHKVIANASVSSFVNKLDEGQLDVRLNYSFDTLGKNLSNYVVLGSSAAAFENDIYNWKSAMKYEIPKKNGYFIKSEANLGYAINWNTKSYQFKYSKRGLKTFGYTGNDVETIRNTISTNFDAPGKYTIKTKQVDANGSKYYLTSFTHYSGNRGPLNVLYSMALPGLGTKLVTYGEKGGGRMFWFLFSAGIAGISKYYSNQFYADYLGSTTYPDLEKNYKAANGLNKTYLFCGGIAASFYIYDFFHVLGRGFKNLGQAKAINRKFKDLPPVGNKNIEFIK